MSDRFPESLLGRRRFLAGAAASTVVLLKPELVRGAQANSALELGMIGCGGRGRWIADLFEKTGKYRFTACSDYFQERVDAFGEKFKVDVSRRFTGLSGYKKLLGAKLDAVVIETPPGFHPEQAAAAVDAGKHVFLAKPIAVDAPGCLLVGESGRKATQKKLVFLVDFQTRASEIYREAVRRVHEGAIGKLVCAEAEYPWAHGPLSGPAGAEERLRQWYTVLPLSGDVIVEQDIHALDVATWILNQDPVRAFGTGGRKIRTGGDIWDHFSVTYWFPEDVVLTFTSIKCVPGIPDAIRCRAYGDQGFIDTDYFSGVSIRGKNPYEGGAMQNLYAEGAVNNIEEFHRAITQGDCSNPTVAPSVRSNLTSVLGRTAAYRGREVTWDEMIKAGERLPFDTAGLKS
ncbi:MAG: Gfo/Idh/MocA family oxidoreductase [Pirellulales bacterium]|nr:Gfo/Idh/MocA family oxidoreductase [Pirellulales bacterium]